jgi:predicted nucleic acid-binding protein
MEDANHEATRSWFADPVYATDEIIAPSILLAEVGGAVARRTGDTSLAHRIVRELLANPRLRIIPISGYLALTGARIAIDLRLKGADAIYVAVARDFGATLVTWDREQRQRSSSAISAITPATQ